MGLEIAGLQTYLVVSSEFLYEHEAITVIIWYCYPEMKTRIYAYVRTDSLAVNLFLVNPSWGLKKSGNAGLHESYSQQES